MIAVVRGAVPGVVVDVRVVVEDDRVSATAAPVASPRVKAPAEATAHGPASSSAPDRNADAPRDGGTGDKDWRRVEGHN